ncbi:MAG: hypothetical protein OEX12_15000 [Gammaproteobacteria bacterium]|nr:hypothetical protein [Gammaproteobacteria bacterium]
MPTIATLTMQREYIRGLLDGLGLETYLFELETSAAGWEMKLECAIEGGWKNITMMPDADLLDAGNADEKGKQRLIDALDKRLECCTRKTGIQGLQ